GGPDATADAGVEAALEAAAPEAAPRNLSFVSDTSWTSYAGTLTTGSPASYTVTQNLGPAREVCLNASAPSHCPSGALDYGYVGSGTLVWAGGNTIPDASWIWRADVNTTSYAPMTVAIFKRDFLIPAQATGSIQIAVDDLAAVFVNDMFIGSTGSLTDVAVAANAQNTLATFDLSPALRVGTNTVTIATEKGPFGCNAGSCPYSLVGAGVVFKGSIHW
ncbi:MAG: hypothetical protein ACRENE_23360, partial [Polyangiaceae bacterium]